MRGWIVTEEGNGWSVKVDVGDLGGHLDTTFGGWSATLAATIRLLNARPVMKFVLFLREVEGDWVYVYSWRCAWD